MITNVSLPLLPDDLSIEILNKMETLLLIRMRHTCSKFDSLVEEHRRKFASRPTLGILLNIKLDQYKQIIFRSFAQNFIVVTKVSSEDLQKKLSGISIKSIEITQVMGTIDDTVHIELINIFKQIRPICGGFWTSATPLEHIVALTDQLTIVGRNEIGFTNPSKMKGSERILSMLSKAKNCSKFTIFASVLTETFIGSIYENVKMLSKVELKTTLGGLHELLWKIYDLKDWITLKSIRASIHLNERKIFPYNSTSFPPYLHIPGPPGNISNVQIFDLRFQFVVMDDWYKRSTSTSICHIYFIEKSEEKLLEVLDNIHCGWYKYSEKRLKELRATVAPIF